jgi:hypothetical protein
MNCRPRRIAFASARAGEFEMADLVEMERIEPCESLLTAEREDPELLLCSKTHECLNAKDLDNF